MLYIVRQYGIRNAYKVLVGKLEEKRPKHRQEDNIKV
jgi:hypothetical protein